ncbi:hypothetical protein EXS73_02945 [Candidatus Pacearchaeota archaeon]|nr:hypothetical protein [Candidatus Pacearchaeota archaeon]
MNLQKILGITALSTALIGISLQVERTQEKAQYRGASEQLTAIPGLLKADKLYDAEQALGAAQSYISQEYAGRERNEGSFFISEAELQGLQRKIKEAGYQVNAKQLQEKAYKQLLEADIARAQELMRKASQRPR